MNTIHTQADSGGPVVEWREYGEFLDYGCVAGVKLAIVSVTPGDARWKVAAADLIAQGISASRSEARTACEAAIRTWFVKAGWPDTSTDRALIRQMREALAPFALHARIPDDLPDSMFTHCNSYEYPMSPEDVAALQVAGIKLESSNTSLSLWIDGVNIGDFRRAAAAYAAAQAIEEGTAVNPMATSEGGRTS